MRLLSMQLHVPIELGRGIVSDIAGGAEVVASARLVPGHGLSDGPLLEPVRI